MLPLGDFYPEGREGRGHRSDCKACANRKKRAAAREKGAKARRSHPPEFKQKVVAAWEESNRSISYTILGKRFNVHPGMVSRWCNKPNPKFLKNAFPWFNLPARVGNSILFHWFGNSILFQSRHCFLASDALSLTRINAVSCTVINKSAYRMLCSFYLKISVR